MSEKWQAQYLDETKLPKGLVEEIEKSSKERRLNKKQREKLEIEVKKVYLKEKFEPGEAIGIIAAQSISEPATQMSLSSREKIVVKYDEKIKILKIGEFVDETIEEFGFKEEGGFEVCDLPRDVNLLVLSLDQEEKLRWKRIKSAIRHKTPRKLIKIKTKSGRQIVATDSHSFVTRKNNQIIPIAGKELKIGDRVPVIRYLPENCVEFLDTDEFTYASSTSNILPKKIHLNSLFGFFIGAYLSEGSCSNTQVNISNVNENFLSNIRKFSKSLSLNYKRRRYKGAFGPSFTLSINSVMLTRFIANTCNKGSKNKKVPDFAYSAPVKFVSNLLRGYFDGDGNISVSRKMIRVHSNSEELIDGIKLLLTRFKIFAHKCKDKKQFYLLIPYKYAPIFLSNIGSNIKEKKKKLEKLSELAQNFWNGKSQDFTDMINGFGDILYKIAKMLKYPTRYVNNFTKRQKIGRTTLYRYIKLFEELAKEKGINIEKELGILNRMLNSDVVWDEIVEISFVSPNSEYVYDLSVEGLETFATFDGMITHNTMRTYHFAGSAGIKITYGLPRLIEIFDAKRIPGTPVMTVYLKNRFNNRNMARKLAERIVEKKVSDLTKRISIILSENLIEIEPINLKVMKKIARIIKENIKDIKVKIKTKKISIYPKTEVDIKELKKIKEKIMKIHVDGIKRVSNAVVRREGNEWIINTIGSNLEEVLNIKEVDGTRTVTNDLHETKKVLGIESARNIIIDEALKTMQEQGLDVDVRHVMLVADIMTFTGNVRPIGRYGVAGAKASILARAAFEETIKHLVKASVRNEIDDFQGIFENVMIGQVVPSGTGMFDLVAKFEESK